MPRASRMPRNKSEQQTFSVTIPANGTPPPAAAPESEKRDFWEEQAKIKSEQWGTEYMIYVYRDDPPQRGLGGYLTKLVEPIDREEFAQRFGGFKYRLMLLKNNRMFAAAKHDVALPPKAVGSMDPAMLGATGFLPTGSGVDQTALIQFADIIRQQVEKQNPADKNVTELLMNASKSAMEIMKTQTPNPLDSIRLLLELQKQNARPEDETTKLLLAKVIEKAFAAPEKDVTAQIQGVLQIAEALGMRSGGGGSRGPDLATMFVSKIPDLVQGAVSLMTKYLAVTENNRKIAELQRLSPGHNLAPGSIPVQPQPTAVPPAAPEPAAPAIFTPLEREPISSAAAELASVPGMPNDGDPAMFERMKQKLVQNILMGVPAEPIVDYISIENPVLITILRESDEAQLKKFFMDDPTLCQAANFPGFETLIKDAVAYMRDNSAASGTGGPN